MQGFVMEGGAICMELLTPRGWASAYTVEAIIMQLAASLVKGQVRAEQDRAELMPGTRCAFLHSSLVSLHSAKVDKCSADYLMAGHTENELCPSYSQLC